MIELESKLVTIKITTRVVAEKGSIDDEFIKRAVLETLNNKYSDYVYKTEIANDNTMPITDTDKKEWIRNKFVDLLELEYGEIYCYNKNYKVNGKKLEKIMLFPQKSMAHEIGFFYDWDKYQFFGVGEVSTDELIKLYKEIKKKKYK